jgi:hypothetical protein
MPDPQIPLSNASYNPSYSVNRSQFEQGIYVEIVNDTRFPPISSVVVTDNAWPDNTQAYIPSDVKLGTQPLSGSFFGPNNPPPSLTAVTAFPKFATLNYVVNSTDFILGQGGFTSLTSPQTAYGTFGALHLLNSTTFSNLSAANSNVNALTGVSLPAGIIYGPFTGLAISAGGPVLAYNA